MDLLQHDFFVALGYKADVIEKYFSEHSFEWSINLHDTGLHTATGGRAKQISSSLNGERCFLTYGDGLSDVNIDKLLEFHTSHKKLATITAIIPPGRYGSLKITDNDSVNGFTEKPRGEFGYVNGGFFVLSPSCIDFIKDDFTSWEKEPLEDLAKKGELMAFKHTKFWQPMDTLRDKNQLEIMWNKNEAPWKIWK